MRAAETAALGGETAVCRTALYYEISGHLQEIQYQEVLGDSAAASKSGRTALEKLVQQHHRKKPI